MTVRIRIFVTGGPMRNGFLCSTMALLASIGPALAQAPVPVAPSEKPAPATAPREAPPAPSDTPPAAPEKMPYEAPPPKAVPANPQAVVPANPLAVPATPPAAPVYLEGTLGSMGIPRADDAYASLWDPGSRFYGSTEYIAWKPQNSPSGDDFGARSGGRFTFGYWVIPEQMLGVESTTFLLESGQTTTFGIGGSGKFHAYGSEVNFRRTLCYFGGATFDLLGGFRFLSTDENATVPTIIDSTTHNRYFGVQAGGSFEWEVIARIVVSGFAKIGLGGDAGTHRDSIPGILIIDTNRTRYNFVPEGNINLGYQLTANLRSTVGYNYLHFSSWERPLSGGNGQSMFLQGINVGFMYRF